jgi:hypothetical protein
MTVDPISEQHTKAIWDALGRALGAEPRDSPTIRGASGLDHAVEAISVDDKNSRVIIFAAESNPRIAALMQVDIQATMPAARVLVARPIAFDAASFARRVVQQIGQTEVNLRDILFKWSDKELEKRELEKRKGVSTVSTATVPPALAELFAPFVLTSKHVQLPQLNQVLAFVQQAASIDWASIVQSGFSAIRLTSLLSLDSMDADRRYGVCPIPLYELTERDWEMFLSGTAINDIQERLKELGIYQYFFPAPDQIALGLADRTRTSTPKIITSAIQLASEIGHPLGAPELVSGPLAVADIVERLQQSDLLVEGELGLEMTETGTTARATVKFRPREGLLSKLLQRVTVNANVSVSPKDLLFPPH